MEAGTLSLGHRQPPGRSMPLSAMSKYLPPISPGPRKWGGYPSRVSVLIGHEMCGSEECQRVEGRERAA